MDATQAARHLPAGSLVVDGVRASAAQCRPFPSCSKARLAPFVSGGCAGDRHIGPHCRIEEVLVTVALPTLTRFSVVGLFIRHERMHASTSPRWIICQMRGGSADEGRWDGTRR
jgi:hypothetical protein